MSPEGYQWLCKRTLTLIAKFIISLTLKLRLGFIAMVSCTFWECILTLTSLSSIFIVKIIFRIDSYCQYPLPLTSFNQIKKHAVLSLQMLLVRREVTGGSYEKHLSGITHFYWVELQDMNGGVLIVIRQKNIGS